MLVALAKTSALTAREQLGVLLVGVLDQRGIKSPKAMRLATAVWKDLEDPKSDLSRALEDLPALKYTV